MTTVHVLDEFPDLDLGIIYAKMPRRIENTLYEDTVDFHTDHAAILLGDTVVDFTMRQFHPESEWPHVSNTRTWNKMLSKYWKCRPVVAISMEDIYDAQNKAMKKEGSRPLDT